LNGCERRGKLTVIAQYVGSAHVPEKGPIKKSKLFLLISGLVLMKSVVFQFIIGMTVIMKNLYMERTKMKMVVK